MDLLSKIKAQPSSKHTNSSLSLEEQLALVLAYTSGEIQPVQIANQLGISRTNVSVFVGACALRCIKAGLLKEAK